MQDEFEIFRAEAYGCGSTTTPDFNDVAEEKEESAGKGAHAESVLFLDFDRRSQHRENNVGIHRFRSSNQRCSQIVIKERDNRLFKGRRSEVGADVMVEIQSPSPTEIPASNLPSRRRYEEEKRMSGGSVKIIGLCRRKTAPADRRLSEKRNVIKESRMKTSRTMAPTESGITIDATLEVLMTSKHSIRKKSTNQPNAIFSSSSRPRDLAVSSNQITRRKSTTCTPERLRPTTQRSPGKHRRNSYAGALQSSPRSLSPPSRISGRRNSAITYLSDRVSCNSPSSPESDTATAARHKSYDELRAATGRRSSSTASRLDHIEQRAMTGEPVDCHSSVDYSLEHLNNMHPESISAGSLELMNAGLSYNSSAIYRILVIGAPGVGKTTLTHQLLTNEYLANKEEPYQGESTASSIQHFEKTHCSYNRLEFRIRNKSSAHTVHSNLVLHFNFCIAIIYHALHHLMASLTNSSLAPPPNNVS